MAGWELAGGEKVSREKAILNGMTTRRGEHGQDRRDPILGGHGVVVDIGDVTGGAGGGSGVARGADAGRIDPDQASASVALGQFAQFGPRGRRRPAIDDQHREPVLPRRLLAQAREAVADIARTVVGANADGQIHDPEITRRG
jgi:hypothetical protein